MEKVSLYKFIKKKNHVQKKKKSRLVKTKKKGGKRKKNKKKATPRKSKKKKKKKKKKELDEFPCAFAYGYFCPLNSPIFFFQISLQFRKEIFWLTRGENT